METDGTLSAAQVLGPMQPMNKPVRRRMNPSNEEFAANDFRLLIGGRLVEGAGILDVINPATGRVLTTSPRADRGQLEQAVAAAKAAFPSWAAMPLRVRGGLLVKLADALEGERSELARLLTQEQGKPLPQAQWEIAQSIGTLRYFATLDLRPSASPGSGRTVARSTLWSPIVGPCWRTPSGGARRSGPQCRALTASHWTGSMTRRCRPGSTCGGWTRTSGISSFSSTTSPYARSTWSGPTTRTRAA